MRRSAKIIHTLCAVSDQRFQTSFTDVDRPFEEGLACPEIGAFGAADKLIETDYWFTGPGKATHKLVGRGQPRTPAHDDEESAS